MKKNLLALFAMLMPLVALAQAKHTDTPYPSFVDRDSVPHVESFLPLPPDTTSMAFFNDYYQYMQGKALRMTPRGEQAVADAELEDFEMFLAGFADAFGYKVTREGMPETYKLLFWGKNDAGNTTYRMKKRMFRKRPYVQFGESTNIPSEEESHRKSSSYPSNHSSSGWGVALLMVELNPARQDEILKRGYEYGQSRVIAGYHYQSDVDAARLAASAAIARVHAEPAFVRQLEKAKKEMKRITNR